jgi:hypothetical protein
MQQMFGMQQQASSQAQQATAADQLQRLGQQVGHNNFRKDQEALRG